MTAELFSTSIESLSTTEYEQVWKIQYRDDSKFTSIFVIMWASFPKLLGKGNSEDFGILGFLNTCTKGIF